MSQLCHTSGDAWLLDTGASHHMCPFADFFSSIHASTVDSVRLADDSCVPVMGEGDIVVEGTHGQVVLRDVLYVPNLGTCLLSVPAVYDHGGRMTLQAQAALIYSKARGAAVLRAGREGRSWVLRAPALSSSSPPEASCLFCHEACPYAGAVQGAGTEINTAPWQVWHARLGHVGLGDLRRMQAKD